MILLLEKNHKKNCNLYFIKTLREKEKRREIFKIHETDCNYYESNKSNKKNATIVNAFGIF